MTQRSYSEVIAQFPDNGTGEISPQDLRDFVDSVRAPHASFSLGAVAETPITVIDQYEKVVDTSVAGAHSHLMTADTACRITYNGTSPRHVHIVASIAMTAASNNQTIAFRIAVNGTTLPESMIERRVGTGSDIGAVAIHADALLNENDYIELYVANETSTANVTVNDLYMFVMGMF
jgi:hypothetical protein